MDTFGIISKLEEYHVDQITGGRALVAQKYIKNQLLSDGLKFDLRVYLVVMGVDPIRAYICEEGICRYQGAKFQEKLLQTPKLTNFNEDDGEFVYQDWNDVENAEQVNQE